MRKKVTPDMPASELMGIMSVVLSTARLGFRPILPSPKRRERLLAIAERPFRRPNRIDG